MSSLVGDAQLPEILPLHLRSPGARRTSRRAAQLGRSFGKHIAPLLARTRGRPSRDQIAKPLRRLCEDMGATFLKYGQLIASAESVFGPDMAAEFRRTLDTGPRVQLSAVRSQISRELRRPTRSVFPVFEREPLGRASLAVVHKAETVDGRIVAVKVLRPHIQSLIASDLQLMDRILPPLARATGLPLDMVATALRAQLSEELDLRNEARTMQYFRAVAEASGLGFDNVYVPEPFPELSGKNVLTMEFLDGVPIDDAEAIASMAIDPTPVVEEVVKSWFLTALDAGVFHGDVHAGNVLMLRDGRIGILDWGIVGRLAAKDHHMFRQMIRGALGDDEARDEVVDDMLETWLPMITASADVDPVAVRELMRTQFGVPLRQPFGQVSLADMLTGPQQDLETLAAEQGTTIRSRKEQRKRLKSSGFTMPEFDRAMILLVKQLAYFERYGKLYLQDISLLHDEAFFRHLLGMDPQPAAD